MSSPTRNTKQRQVVYDVLSGAKRPLTVIEVLSRAQKKLGGIGIATVYREISRLLESSELQTVSIPGDPPRYEMHAHHHHHFKCTDCGKVYEVEGCLKDINRLVPKSFTLKSHDITLYGTCDRCA